MRNTLLFHRIGWSVKMPTLEEGVMREDMSLVDRSDEPAVSDPTVQYGLRAGNGFKRAQARRGNL